MTLYWNLLHQSWETKSQLIDPENSSSAVKQALAEAHVIGDVRKYFEDRGVDLTSFDKKERDDKIILVKNFPFGTTIDEIGELFSAYGQLKRMLMPPAGTIAIIEFRDAPVPGAFSKLAYKRFKSSILYLEKGQKTCLPVSQPPTRLLPFQSNSKMNMQLKLKYLLMKFWANLKRMTKLNWYKVQLLLFREKLEFCYHSASFVRSFQTFAWFCCCNSEDKTGSKEFRQNFKYGFWIC